MFPVFFFPAMIWCTLDTQIRCAKRKLSDKNWSSGFTTMKTSPRIKAHRYSPKKKGKDPASGNQSHHLLQRDRLSYRRKAWRLSCPKDDVAITRCMTHRRPKNKHMLFIHTRTGSTKYYLIRPLLSWFLSLQRPNSTPLAGRACWTVKRLMTFKRGPNPVGLNANLSYDCYTKVDALSRPERRIARASHM